ncbi:acyltransferase [Massilia sp. YIM B02763]|uniref:acyltransferase family protein n=1 Tax=Massilia sp. YIM B02763 TaxID=3050130 RepID=UPI0025B71098|nr:acyltransferase [Massilia sp. YIM B02763]MDN4052491.1 acyltransferase [Massilia sp. YIM B02763]
MISSDKHVPYLDGWRGLAILAVYFGHFYGHGKYWWVGVFGVHLFFVLSGYLMCNILFIKKTALSDFFVSRCVRVYPTFLLFIAGLLVYSATLQPDPFLPSFAEISSTVSFLRTYLPYGMAISNEHWAIAHLWSLNVEEHSYVFLALIALLTRRAQTPWLAGVMLATATIGAWAIGNWYFSYPPSGASHFSVRTEVASLGLLCGATVRYIRYHAPLRIYSMIPFWLPLASIAIAYWCFVSYQYKGLHITLAPILLACAINFMDRVPGVVTAILSNAVLRWFGTCSFSLYLWQQPLHALTIEYGSNAFLMSALAISIGAMSFYAFENPVRKKLNTAWRNRCSSKNLTSSTSSVVVQGSAGAGLIRLIED